MPAHRTARERARAELTAAIKDEARGQLGQSGAGGLSLRAVARELGMVSSALYRYFPSRDDLLTALIIDAYNSLGHTLETAGADSDVPRERWRDTAHALRDWARGRPHEYTLLYGTPVPGYRAPQDTIGPASRVPGAFLRVVHDAWHAGAVDERTVPAECEPGATLHAQLGDVTEALGLELPDDVLLRAAIAWTQLSGMVGFELTGQFANTLDPADEFFAHAAGQMSLFIGLR